MKRTVSSGARADDAWRPPRASRWLLIWIASGCVLDSDDRCGERQVLWENDMRCVCEEGTAYTPEGCVPCGANEIASAAGCACAPGFGRPAPELACEELPPGIGAPCATPAECLDPTYPYCQVGASGGYCTTANCTTSADCTGGYTCNLGATPTHCQRPPLGAGTPCTSPADCAGTDAIFCDTFVTGTCLVQDCSLAPDNCYMGSECCDLSNVGLPLNLCVAAGQCMR
jgi:hypothetical protein